MGAGACEWHVVLGLCTATVERCTQFQSPKVMDAIEKVSCEAETTGSVMQLVAVVLSPKCHSPG